MFASQLAALHPRTCENWVDINGIPIQEQRRLTSSWEDVLYSEGKPDLQNIRLRGPDQFVAVGHHRNPEAWDRILVDHPQKHTIGDWVRNKIEISNFTRHFKGSFKGQYYCSVFPPSKQFSNHASCKAFSDFVSKEILKRLTTGALRVWGRVGDDSPPYLVLPLTVEPTKPRLCLDARFLDLWMTDVPFSLDRLADVPRYVYRGSYRTKCDDKSGYDHVSL